MSPAPTPSTAEALLRLRGVRPTANRLLVVRSLAEAGQPLSLADLEAMLAPMDKASIFRTLTTLTAADLTHAFEDGSGSTKYELCHAAAAHSQPHSPGDMHAHFHCTGCSRTFCLDNAAVPAIDLPEGFVLRQINYTAKGLCPSCAAREG